MTDLAIGSASRLADLEDVVERGLSTFVEVGEALLAIRDERLYRLTHGTWEAYLAERWQMTRSRAHRLIDGAEVARMLPMGNVTTERVARELVPVMRQDPVSLPDVMAAATVRAGDRPVTAADVRAEVRDRFRSMAAESEQEMAVATAHYTPEQREAVSAERMRQLGELRRLVHDIAALPDPDSYAESFGRWLTREFHEEATAARRWLEALLRRLEAA